MYIYLTTNLVNGKKYIGQHNGKQSWYLGSGSIFYKAFKKYGRKNFKKEILCYCDSNEELNQKEIYYIDYYNAVEDKDYYNLRPGGKYATHSKETRIKISEKKKNYKFTKEHIKNMSISHKGHKQKFETIEKRAAKLRGIPRDPKVMEKILSTRKKRKEEGFYGKTLNPYRKLYCLILENKEIIEFTGYKEAKEVTNLDKSTIFNSIKQKRRMEKYIFSFENNKDYFNTIYYNKCRCKSIEQFSKTGELLNSFNSIKEAAEKLNYSKTSIWRCLGGERKTYKKCMWKYKEGGNYV
jgi:hypothetical protein